MLTVKVNTSNNNLKGFSFDKEVIFSALSVKTEYVETSEGVVQTVFIEDFKGNMHSFDIKPNRRIFVENSSGKTVQVYRISA